MDKFGSEVATLLLLATPLLIFAKVVHGIVVGRVSLARRGSLWVKAELGAWSLLAAIDTHILTLWLASAHQAEDLCMRYRPQMGTDVYLDGGYFLEFPVRVRCVWPDGESMNVASWPLNVLTAVFFTAAVAITAYTAVQGFRRSRSRRHHAVNGDPAQ